MELFEFKKFLRQTFLIYLVWMNGNPTYITCEPEDRTAQMQKVKEKVLLNYDKFIRPTLSHSNTTEVHTVFIPKQIINVDEERAIFSLDSFLALSWIDPRLQWNLSDYNGYLQLPSNQLWVPDISVFNSHSLQVDPTQEVLILFESNGRVYWIPPILTETTCGSLGRPEGTFPQDEVECVISMGSWMHDGWQINFDVNDNVFMNELQNVHPRWELITDKARCVRNVTYYQCCPEPYLRIDFFIPIRRRPDPAVDATRTPCILVMVLTLAVFWFPPDSSKKVLLPGFLFLTLNVLLVYVGCSTKGPSTVLSAVSFLRTAMYLAVITLLFQVLVITKIASFAGPARPPTFVMHFLTGPVGMYVCFRYPSPEDALPLDRMMLKEDSTTEEYFGVEDEWKMVATALDRALFVVMAISMVAVRHL